VFAAGCVSSYVADVRVEGFELVVERCYVRGDGATTECDVEQQPLPARLAPDRGPRRTSPFQDAAYRRIGAAHERLAACKAGPVEVQIVLDERGLPSDIAPPELATCVRDALGIEPFEVSRRRTTIAFTILPAEAR
jgi:hypothetical protein